MYKYMKYCTVGNRITICIMYITFNTEWMSLKFNKNFIWYSVWTLFSRYTPPGFFETLTVRAMNPKHDLSMIHHWKGGLYCRYIAQVGFIRDWFYILLILTMICPLSFSKQYKQWTHNQGNQKYSNWHKSNLKNNTRSRNRHFNSSNQALRFYLLRICHDDGSTCIRVEVRSEQKMLVFDDEDDKSREEGKYAEMLWNLMLPFLKDAEDLIAKFAGKEGVEIWARVGFRV